MREGKGRDGSGAVSWGQKVKGLSDEASIGD